MCPEKKGDYLDFFLFSTNDDAIDANNRTLKREIRMLKARTKILENGLSALLMDIKIKDYQKQLEKLKGENTDGLQ